MMPQLDSTGMLGHGGQQVVAGIANSSQHRDAGSIAASTGGLECNSQHRGSWSITASTGMLGA